MYRKWKGRSVLNVILKIVKDVKKDTRSDGLRNEKYACKCGPMKQLMSISGQWMPHPSFVFWKKVQGKLPQNLYIFIRRGFPLLFQANRLLDFLQGM